MTLAPSSGTTGLPKVVVLTDHILVAGLCQTVAVELTTGDDVVAAVLPWFHILAQQLANHLGLAARARTPPHTPRPGEPGHHIGGQDHARHLVDGRPVEDTCRGLTPMIRPSCCWPSSSAGGGATRRRCFWLLSHPKAYRAATETGGAALRVLPHFAIYNRLNAWGRHRDIPALSKRPFTSGTSATAAAPTLRKGPSAKAATGTEDNGHDRA